jgi:hypothetical protein
MNTARLQVHVPHIPIVFINCRDKQTENKIEITITPKLNA